MSDLNGLPGAELVEAGLADLAADVESVPALLIAIAGARLRRLGLPVPVAAEGAELKLYRMLVLTDGAGAHSRYNSLLRRIASFASALEREQGQALRIARNAAAAPAKAS